MFQIGVKKERQAVQEKPDDLTRLCAQIRAFLLNTGIEAEVRPDQFGPLIIVTREQYNQRRGFFESWFALVEGQDDYLVFRERNRGTGTTIDTSNET